MRHFMFAWFSAAIITLCHDNCYGGIPTRQDDICGVHNGKRLYLELGDRGILTAKNLSISSEKFNHVRSHDQCSVEIVTCPSCVIAISFRQIALPFQCGGEVMVDNNCHCDYIWLSEPPYDETSGTSFCGNFPSPTVSINYRSQTRTVLFTLLYSQQYRLAFTLEYSSEKNVQIIKGSPTSISSNGNVSHGGTFSSPFFPSTYPRDYNVEYVVSCEADSIVNCRIRLIFSDFQLADVSIIEIFDSSGQQLDVSSGLSFRPPVILSKTSSIRMRFYANGRSAVGFKAIYSFITGNLEEKSVRPITDCGGYVANLGGAITMMNMVDRSKGDTIRSYDCVWLIKPPGNFFHLKTHLYIKVGSFLDMAGNTELTIRQGQTSEGPLLETVRHPMAHLSGSRVRSLMREHIIPLNIGYYVSLRGFFNVASRLAIVYSTFTYMDCFTGSDFLCQNHRCIPAILTCDGFDHCGDSSDEPETCTREWEAQPVDRRWYSHTPNYYFPKMERYPDLKTATLVFLISSVGLIMLIAALVVLLYRMGTRARQQRQLQDHLQTISELLDGARIEEVIAPPDEPPDYEAPPEYEEILKSTTGSSQLRRKRRRRTRSSPGPRALLGNTVTAESSQSQSGDTDSIHFRSLTPQLSTNISRSCQVTPIPDSPPPPYSEGYLKLVQNEREIEAWVNMNSDTSDLAVVITSPSPQASCNRVENTFRPESTLMISDSSDANFYNKTIIKSDLPCISADEPGLRDVMSFDNEIEEIQQPLVVKNDPNGLKTSAANKADTVTFPNFELRDELRKISGRPTGYKKGRNRYVYSLDDHRVRRKRYKAENMCHCKGACDCAVNSSRPRSWASPSYDLPRSDAYFTDLKFDYNECTRDRCFKERIWKSPESSSLFLSINSTDNLQDLV